MAVVPTAGQVRPAERLQAWPSELADTSAGGGRGGGGLGGPARIDRETERGWGERAEPRMDGASLQGQRPKQVERVAWTEPCGGEAAPGVVYTTNSSRSWSFWSRLGNRELTDPLSPGSSARRRAWVRGAGRGAGSGRVWSRLLRLCWCTCPAAALGSRICRQR